MKSYRIYLLGGLKFESGPHRITRFRTQKTATLLAYLALHPGPQPREVLADLLWPDDAPEAARHSLRMALSSLRRQLESALQTVAGNREPLFEATRFAIGLRSQSVSTDIADFDAAIKRARHANDSDERARHYAAALEVYGGAFLPGFYDDWCVEEAARLEVALAVARQFVENWRGPTRGETPDKALPLAPAKTRLATLLIFDGAAATRAQIEAIRAHDGTKLKTESPAQAWIFASASAALASARVLRDSWRRMALCTGEINASDAGALRNRARGLLASAGAGQTVCCQATALFERGREDIACRELGSFHLSQAPPGAPPERIIQVSWAHETAREFPPLQARAARGASVPRPLDGFFGRELELKQLQFQLQNARLVTLTGIGGAGKTRLALQLAAQLEIERAAPFRGAVVWVALADVPDANGIASAICEALHLERADRALEAASAALHQAPATLLVLDNFEHLVETGAATIERLLESAPAAHCLVTSRRLLGARGEVEICLAPLAVPELTDQTVTVESLQSEPSVQLFCDRARGVRPDFALTARNVAPIVALCRHLEGLPLALELAAARVGNAAPAQILERLQARQDASEGAFERLDFLSGGARTTPARHRTLRATLSWSYDDLDEALQRLFARLWCFRGGCTVEAARAVCDAPDAASELESLRARSLIQREFDAQDTPRYSLLETVRQYAFDLAATRGEVEITRCAHAAYFLEWAQNEAPHATASDAEARLRSWNRVRAEADNLRAALNWSCENQPKIALQLVLACHNFSGHHLSRVELGIERALRGARNQQIEPSLLAEALGLAATQAAQRGDVPAQTAFARQRLQLMRDSPDPKAVAWAWFDWGCAQREQGEFGASRQSLERSRHLFEQIEGAFGFQCVGWTLIEMGNASSNAGDLETAAQDFTRCAAAFEHSGDRDGQASATAQLADVLFHQGQLSNAAQLWPQVTAIEAELNDEREHEWRRHQAGKLAVAQGDLERGHQLLLRALWAFRKDNQKAGMLNSLLALSACWLARQQPARALRLLQTEQQERAHLGWPPDGKWRQMRNELWQNARSNATPESQAADFFAVVEEELRAAKQN